MVTIPLRVLCLDSIIDTVERCNETPVDRIFDQLPLPNGVISNLTYRNRAKIEWIQKHTKLFHGTIRRYLNEIEWYDDVTIDHTLTMLKLLKLSSIDDRSKFELASVYCILDETVRCWNCLTVQDHVHYLAERSGHCDPIVTFWTGMCGNQPWLADSYLGTVKKPQTLCFIPYSYHVTSFSFFSCCVLRFTYCTIQCTVLNQLKQFKVVVVILYVQYTLGTVQHFRYSRVKKTQNFMFHTIKVLPLL